MDAQRNGKRFFPVDNCFGTDIGRPLAELVEENGISQREEMVSFEEFVRGADYKRGTKAKDDEWSRHFVSRAGLRPIDHAGGEGADYDEFFDISLNGGGTVPEDPTTATDGMPKGRDGGGRSELYKVQQQHTSNAAADVVDDDSDKWCFTDSRQRQWEGAVCAHAATTKLRHSLCPTVGEGGGWLSGGRMRRESQDSAAYGYEPPEEPWTTAKAANATNDRPNAPLSPRDSSARRSLSEAERQRENGTSEAKGTHDGSQMVQSNSLGDLMLFKFLCCFRALNPTQMGGTERKGGGGTAEKRETDKSYSWDRREDGPVPNAADFRFVNESGKTLVKEPGQLNGQPFLIEQCKDSLILLMDRTASVTVDDSRNCVILTGPCQGSIFLRDCSNILILAVCQQFRTRDCRQLFAHLFCATSPTIEETDATIGPLLLNYSELLGQMCAAGLSPFVNHWDKVHNFTPETGKYQLIRHNAIFPITAPHNFSLVERFNDFVVNSPLVNQWKLCVGNPRNSQLFVEEKDEKSDTNGKKDIALVLLQSVDGLNPGLRFYAESVQISHALLGLEDVRLIAMHDVDLKAGEWEVLLGKSKQQKQHKKRPVAGKMISLEIEGSEITKNAIEFLHSMKNSSVKAQVVDSERMEQYKKQLYRFCDIRQSI